MKDYYKRTIEGQVSRAFVWEDPANFDIKNSVLSGLKDNLFDRNTVRDLWALLARFYEAASMCKLDDVTEDQVKLRLFGFSLIGRDKAWLLFLSNGKIWIWKELEDKFLERLFTTTQFAERSSCKF